MRPHSNSLSYALWVLSSQCDGAFSRDQVGFTAADAKKGNKFANIPEERWTTNQRHIIWKLLQKYHRQLDIAGVDLASIPEPIVIINPNPPKEKMIIHDGVAFRIIFPFDKGTVHEVKAIPGAHFFQSFSEKYWIVPSEKASTEGLLHFIVNHPEYYVSDAVKTILHETQTETR